MMLFICTSVDICEWWGASGLQSQREYDLERELELDPHEEIEVELVPIDWAEVSDE